MACARPASLSSSLSGPISPGSTPRRYVSSGNRVASVSEPRALTKILICPRQERLFQRKRRAGLSPPPSVAVIHNVSPRHIAACQALRPPRMKHSAPWRVRRTERRSPGWSFASAGPSTSASPSGATVSESRSQASPIASSGSCEGTPSGRGGGACGSTRGGGGAVVSTGAPLGSAGGTGVPTGRGAGAQAASARQASATIGTKSRRLMPLLPE